MCEVGYTFAIPLEARGVVGLLDMAGTGGFCIERFWDNDTVISYVYAYC